MNKMCNDNLTIVCISQTGFVRYEGKSYDPDLVLDAKQMPNFVYNFIISAPRQHLILHPVTRGFTYSPIGFSNRLEVLRRLSQTLCVCY